MNAPKTIKIKSAKGTEFLAHACTSPLVSCCGCGQPIPVGAPMVACPDCGGLFCKSCAEDGTFEDHECEPDDFED